MLRIWTTIFSYYWPHHLSTIFSIELQPFRATRLSICYYRVNWTFWHTYVPNAPSDFPEAEQLLAVKSEGNVNISVTLYENNEAMERATAAKNKVMDAIQGIVSVDTKVGSVILDHSN